MEASRPISQRRSPRPSNRRTYLPFIRLVRHFLARLVRGGHESETSDFQFGAGPLLGVLASPGGVFSLLLFQKYSTLRDWIVHRPPPDVGAFSAPDKYFFICLAMGAAGILTAIKWDRILPDSQDYLNLAPLPVSPRTIFLANATAVAIAVGVVAFTVNLFSSFFFPLIVASYAHFGVIAIVRLIAAHAISLTLANVFTFCAILALLGTLTALLPRAIFRAFSAWIRGAVLVGSAILLVAGPSAPRNPEAWTRFYPPLWFLGLYQNLEGRITAAMRPMADFAVEGFAIALVWMLAAYALGYRRSFAATLETTRPPRSQPLARSALAFFDLFASGARGLERGIYRFLVRAFLRTEAHRMCLAVALGLGYVIAARQAASNQPGIRLEAPFTAAYLLLLGLRIAFELPAGAASNWIFRASLNPATNPAIGAARRVVFAMLSTFVLAPAFVIACRDMGFLAALLHVVVVAALSISLTEFFLLGYRKIPLTCPMPPFGEDFLARIVLQIVAFGAFMQMGGALDSWFLHKPFYLPLLPTAMFGAWVWNRRRLAEDRANGELEESLLFDNPGLVVVTRMELLESLAGASSEP